VAEAAVFVVVEAVDADPVAGTAIANEDAIIRTE
jgi:hypothetical protein